MTAIPLPQVTRYVQDLEATWAFRLRMATEHEREDLRALNALRRVWAKTTLLMAVLGMTDLRRLLHAPDGVVIGANPDGWVVWDTLADGEPEPRIYVRSDSGFLRYYLAFEEAAAMVPIDEVRGQLQERITERIAAITSEERALTAVPGDPDRELYKSSQEGTRRWQRQRLLEHRWPSFFFARSRLRQLRGELEDQRGW